MAPGDTIPCPAPDDTFPPPSAEDTAVFNLHFVDVPLDAASLEGVEIDLTAEHLDDD